jgi:NDP-sugar pyrophosphorylase family protein
VLALLADGKRVAAFPSDAEWYDIGTIAEYERAILALETWPAQAGIERTRTGSSSSAI